MPKTSTEPTLFLQRYRELITLVVRLAFTAAMTPSRLLEDLSREPFVVPAAVRDRSDAAQIAASLDALSHDTPAEYSPSELHSELRKIVRNAIESEYRPSEQSTREVGLGSGRRAPEPSSPPKGPKATPPGRTTERWINAEIEGRSLDDPLEMSTSYTLAFDIDLVSRQGTLHGGPIDIAKLFPQGVDEIALTVQLESDDFDIDQNVQPLRLPRDGPSSKARFGIEPRKTGRAILYATFHKDGNFVQHMEIVLFVVAPGRARDVATPAAAVTSHGRPPTTLGSLLKREVSLSILPSERGGYLCIVTSTHSNHVTLPIGAPELEKAIDVARSALMDVIDPPNVSHTPVFQTDIEIPAADNEMALTKLARAGALLFTSIFYHPKAGLDVRALGDWLRSCVLDRASPLNLQVSAEDFPVPWGLLYVGDAGQGAKLDWNLFLGFSSIIEVFPYQIQFSDPGPTISSKPHLAVSVNVNDGIDADMARPLVKDQQTFWTRAAAANSRLRLTSRRTRDEVLHALGAKADDQITYFYCHANAKNLATAGGPGSSALVMSDGESITLDDLNIEAPTADQLPGSPLVFINGCESAQLSPTFYNGFVPYFIAKGARGVIGTECNTPGVFAAEWARRFFPRFLSGESIGDAFFDLRREFLQKHNNPLGLLYAVYCNGDTRVAPAL